jgi:hypothetical protein
VEALLTGVNAPAITTAAAPLAALGVGLVLTFVLAPRLAIKAFSFLKRLI